MTKYLLPTPSALFKEILFVLGVNIFSMMVMWLLQAISRNTDRTPRYVGIWFPSCVWLFKLPLELGQLLWYAQGWKEQIDISMVTTGLNTMFLFVTLIAQTPGIIWKLSKRHPGLKVNSRYEPLHRTWPGRLCLIISFALGGLLFAWFNSPVFQ